MYMKKCSVPVNCVFLFIIHIACAYVGSKELHVYTAKTNSCNIQGEHKKVTPMTFVDISAIQCFDTVGWVIWPVKTRPHMPYNVLVGR